MAVLSVKVASIIGVASALDDVVKVCGKSRIFHPDDALSFYSKTKSFAPFSEKNEFYEPLKKLKDIVLAAGKTLELVEIEGFEASYKEINEYVDYMSQKLKKLIDARQSVILKLNEYNKALEQIKPFIGLNINLEEISKCKYIKARFGRLPRESYEKLSSQKENPYVLFFPCTSNKEYFWGVYFAPVEYCEEIDRIFAGLYFERMRVSEKDGTPESKLAQIKKYINIEREELRKANEKLNAFWDIQKDQCKRVYTRLEELETYGEIKKHVSKYHNNFILVGWIPEEDEMDFAQALDATGGIEYSIDKIDDGDKKHKPPIKLRNNWFARPFETFVSMYGLPDYREIDPTLFVAITYTLMYGAMFGDLGHGVILSLVGAILWKFKSFSLGKIMVRCGISSSIFGIFYGSVFGYENLLNPLYQKFFGLHEKPIEIMDHEMIIKVIAAAVGLGVGLIIVAMVLKIYSSIKRNDMESALFSQNGLAGLIFYSSLTYGVIFQMLFGIKIFTPLYIICLIILPIVFIFFKEPLGKLMIRDPNWKPESMGEYILQNIFEIFVVLLEYVTNTISFLRVGAYVLVHAGLMMAVFIIADMLPPGANIIMIIFGNLFVIALEGLLVGIQVLRLEFYEMFSRFFDGEGNAFEPVRLPVK
ncbi:MAG: V/A-type H+/Na+-transporting ATPase subunit I [Eubacteriales bacterium SKADARSKE-1]|nr:V/A-type H+/Na+-transporting ATPase subunit I [Eubacteriales bacterium SKADARSKE-1]